MDDISTHPFLRARSAENIIRVDGPPARRNDVAPSRQTFSHVFTSLLPVLLLATLVGCAPSRPISPTRAPASEETVRIEFDSDQRARLDRLHAVLGEPALAAHSEGLLVRLAFDEAADLDLFVTDPMQESVYFANSPTRSGGTLVDDRRCEDPSPRVEVVHFSTPESGRYRVGVDFHRRCKESSLSRAEEKQGLYVVRVDEAGRVLEREGRVSPGQFEVIVIEFEVE